MTSRDMPKLVHSVATNADNQVNHKSYLYRETHTGIQANSNYHDETIIEGVNAHPVPSISGILQQEQHKKRLARPYNHVNSELDNDPVINMNQLWNNSILPRVIECNEDSKSTVSVSPVKGNFKCANKQVQTSRTRIKVKRTKHGDEVKRHHSKSVLIHKLSAKNKKDIYIITDTGNPLKGTSVSQELISNESKQQGTKKHTRTDKKFEGNTSINCDIKPSSKVASAVGKPNATQEVRNRELSARSRSPSTEKYSTASNKNLSTANDSKATEHSEKSKRNGKVKDSNKMIDNQKDKDRVNVGTMYSQISIVKKCENIEDQNEGDSRRKSDYPKVVSTKLKYKEHKHKRSDMIITEKTRSVDDTSRKQKHSKKEHRHKHMKQDIENKNFEASGEHTTSEDKMDPIITTNQVSTVTQTKMRKPRSSYKESTISIDDIEADKRRKLVLDNIEKAYSKHKHILPKEAVEALDQCLRQGRHLDPEITSKGSDQKSNILDLGAVLKKHKKDRFHIKESNFKQNLEKATSTASESTLLSGFRKNLKQQNDLILLNAIVTGMNNIRCKDTVRINKIPKFVRLDEVFNQPDLEKQINQETGLMDMQGDDNDRRFSKRRKGKFNVPTLSDDIRREVSFSHLNITPTVNVGNVNESQFNYIDGLLPNLLKEKKLRSAQKKITLDSEFGNVTKEEVGEDLVEEDSPSADIKVNIDGVEPPKRHAVNIPSAYISRKGVATEFNRLEMAVLPILEVNHNLVEPDNTITENSSLSYKVLKNTRTQTRKKEDHRVQKFSRSSASSSDSTLQLFNVAESGNEIHGPAEKKQKKNEKLLISDKEAIAALKYLPPQHKEYINFETASSPRKKNLQKIILSTIEIKPDVKNNYILIEDKNSAFRRFNQETTLVPSKETVLAHNTNHPTDAFNILPNSNFSIKSLRRDYSLEDYVTSDKYSMSSLQSDSQKRDRRRKLSFTSTGSIPKQLENTSESYTKGSLQFSPQGFRSRMLNYSKNTEQRKHRKSSPESSRESSYDREKNSAQKYGSKVPLRTHASDDKQLKERSKSNSGMSSSSAVSINSDSDKHSVKSNHASKREATIENMKQSQELLFQTKDVINNLPSDVISAALTKITEETASQDTLSEISNFSRRTEEEICTVIKAKGNRRIGNLDKNTAQPKPLLLDANKGQLNSNQFSLTEALTVPLTLKPVTIQRLKKDDDTAIKSSSHLNTSVYSVNPPSATHIKGNLENMSIASASTNHLKEEEIRFLTETMKNSIISEIQAINTVNINTLMQAIMKKKDESDNNILEALITKNIVNVLKKQTSAESVDSNKTNKRQPTKINSNDLKFLEAPDRPKSSEKRADLSRKSSKSSHTGSVRVSKRKKEVKVVEKRANLETKYVSKLPVMAAKSLANKPLSAPTPTSTDNKIEDIKRTPPAMEYYDKTVKSETKTILTSATVSSPKETVFKLSKDDKNKSKFEKRKLYGEALRQKIVTKPRIENEPYDMRDNLADGNQNVGENFDRKPPVNEIENPNALLDNELQIDPSSKSNLHSDSNPSSPTVSRRSRSRGKVKHPTSHCNPTVQTSVYQTFTVMADYPNIVDVFKDKFRKYSITTISKTSLHQSQSNFSIKNHKSIFNAKSATLIDYKKSKFFNPVETQSLSNYCESFKQNEQESICSSQESSDLHHSKHYGMDDIQTKFRQFSIEELGLLEVCQQLTRDDNDMLRWDRKCIHNTFNVTGELSTPIPGNYARYITNNNQSVDNEGNVLQGMLWPFKETREIDDDHVVFEIHRPQHTSGENFKILMNNNVKNVRLDSSSLNNGFKPTLFSCSDFFVDQSPPPVMHEIECDSGQNTQKRGFLHSFICARNEYLTAINFPDNLKSEPISEKNYSCTSSGTDDPAEIDKGKVANVLVSKDSKNNSRINKSLYFKKVSQKNTNGKAAMQRVCTRKLENCTAVSEIKRDTCTYFSSKTSVGVSNKQQKHQSNVISSNKVDSFSKSFDDKLTQTEAKQKLAHKQEKVELKSCSTSYDYIEISSSTTNGSQLLLKGELINLMQSNAQFHILIANIIKNMLLKACELPINESLQFLKSFIKKMNDESNFSKENIFESDLSENSTDLQIENQLSIQTTISSVFNKLLIELLQNILKKVLESGKHSDWSFDAESNIVEPSKEVQEENRKQTEEEIFHTNPVDERAKNYSNRKEGEGNLKASTPSLDLFKNLKETLVIEQTPEEVVKDLSDCPYLHSHCKANDCCCKTTDLLKTMSKIPLSTILELHKRIENCDNSEISFETLIQELCEIVRDRSQLLNTTESQCDVLNALHRTNVREIVPDNKDSEESITSVVVVKDKMEEMLKAEKSKSEQVIKQIETEKEVVAPMAIITKNSNEKLENHVEEDLNQIKQKLTSKDLFDILLNLYEKDVEIVEGLSHNEVLQGQLFLNLQNRATDENIIKELKCSSGGDEEEVRPTIRKSSRLLMLKNKVSRLFKRNNHFVENSRKRRSSGQTEFLNTKKKHMVTRMHSSLDLESNSNCINPEEIGKYFWRSLQTDQMQKGSTADLNDTPSLNSVMEFSRCNTPLDFLLNLGYSIDEANNAIRDEDVKNRLFAAIVEARIWVNQITTVQGTLIYLIAYKVKPKIMQYYSQLVQAVVNNRINDAVKLDSFLKILEKLEDGDMTILQVLGSDNVLNYN
ncbi:hypothetical protein FQA39_LY00990 [Lamprigera yunnana]|nr:hypothetical protein FQA39_LY00990 [Lamprigera yunnana]